MWRLIRESAATKKHAEVWSRVARWYFFIPKSQFGDILE
jgi:hypothetical protein